MPSALLASPIAAPVRPAWYRVARIALSLSPLLAVHFALLAIPFVEFTWWSVLAIVVVTRIVGLGVTVGLHRYFSHRSFKTSRLFQFLLAAAGCTALQKGPLWWAIHHRLHHRHSDRPDDPHSPVVDGFWYGHIGWLFARDLMNPDPSAREGPRRSTRNWSGSTGCGCSPASCWPPRASRCWG